LVLASSIGHFYTHSIGLLALNVSKTPTEAGFLKWNNTDANTAFHLVDLNDKHVAVCYEDASVKVALLDIDTGNETASFAFRPTVKSCRSVNFYNDTVVVSYFESKND